MNRFAKSACPAPWSTHSDGHGSATPAASPAQPSMPSPAPRVPVTGCRGKGLLSIPPAVGRPAWAQTPSIKGGDGRGGYESVMPLGKSASGQSLRELSASAYPIPSQSAASSQVSFMVTTAPTSQLPFTLPSFPEVSISKIPRTSTSTMQTQATPSTLASTSAANLSSSSSALPQQVSTRKAAPPV